MMSNTPLQGPPVAIVGRRVAALVAPLAAIFVVAFAFYGVEGPPDSARVDSAARLIGMAYGVYAVVLIVRWRKAARAK
jgi:hypothetical protein